MAQRCFSTYLAQNENAQEAPPTRAERFGHQPRQAAGDLGSGEVVVVEALDGGDDEGPSHPSAICRISHRRRLSASRCRGSGGSVSRGSS